MLFHFLYFKVLLKETIKNTLSHHTYIRFNGKKNKIKSNMILIETLKNKRERKKH
jgi:hypothetical protein